MTPEESGELGKKAAELLFEPIAMSMQIPGLHREFWWGGFYATLATYGHEYVGVYMLTVLQSSINEALAKLPAASDKRS